MEEIWKPYIIVNHNQYGAEWIRTDIEISNYGNVRGKMFKHIVFTEDMITVINGRRCILKTPIYHFVWTVFNGPVPKGYAIHHKDHNKLNDRLDNLILMTRSEHSIHHGKNQSLEQRIKHSNDMKGRPSCNKGKTFSEEARQHMSDAAKGRIPWNKGKKCPQLSLAKTGKSLSDEHKKKLSDSHKGKTAWNKGLTKETDIRVAKYSHKKQKHNVNS